MNHNHITDKNDNLYRLDSLRLFHTTTWIVNTYQIEKDGKVITSAMRLNQILCQEKYQSKAENGSFVIAEKFKSESYVAYHKKTEYSTRYVTAKGVIWTLKIMSQLDYKIKAKDNGSAIRIVQIRSQ